MASDPLSPDYTPSPDDLEAQAEYDASPELQALLDQARAAKTTSHRRKPADPATPTRPSKWDDRSWLVRATVFEVVLAVLALALAAPASSLILVVVGALAVVQAIMCGLRARALGKTTVTAPK